MPFETFVHIMFTKIQGLRGGGGGGGGVNEHT